MTLSELQLCELVNSAMLVKTTYWCFMLLIVQKKPFHHVTLGSGNCIFHYFFRVWVLTLWPETQDIWRHHLGLWELLTDIYHYFLIFYILSDTDTTTSVAYTLYSQITVFHIVWWEGLLKNAESQKGRNLSENQTQRK